MDHCFQITYTSVITGERKTYMNIGFETKASAVAEKNRLIREAKKHKGKYDLNDLYMSNSYVPTVVAGKNWRIKKTFFRKIKN